MREIFESLLRLGICPEIKFSYDGFDCVLQHHCRGERFILFRKNGLYCYICIKRVSKKKEIHFSRKSTNQYCVWQECDFNFLPFNIEYFIKGLIEVIEQYLTPKDIFNSLKK